MPLRRAITLAVLTVLLAGTVTTMATGYEGSSVYDNVAPEAQVKGLSERYPSSRYGLDYHVSAGVTSTDIGIGSLPTGVDVDGIPALIMHWLASVIWDFTRFVSNFVITLFAFAFSLDLLTGAGGALRPVRDAVHNLYDSLGTEWLAIVISLVGAWAAWRALVMREVTRTFGQLGVSMLAVFIALLIITQPGWTIGGTSHWSNELSNALLGAVNGDDTQGAKTAAADAMFESLVYDPWVVMEFGGIVHCVDADNKPVKPSSSECRTKINHKTKYAERWLKAGSPNGKQRTLEYAAIKDGKAPPPQAIDDANMPANAFDGYHLSDADKPAVDVQQQNIASERVGAALLVLFGSAGAWLLIGGLSIGVILAQVIALLMFAFAPLMLLVGIIPGSGHRAFRLWMERLLLALTRKIWYALILAVVLALARAITKASADLGWVMAFGLLATFYWAVFLNRKEIAGALEMALPGTTGTSRYDRSLGERAQRAYYTSRMLQPAAAFAAGAVTGAVAKGHQATKAVGRTARGGAGTAVDMANAAASNGHAEQMTAAAVIRGRALDDLHRDYERDQQRLSTENANRSRVAELQRREQMAAADEVPGAHELALDEHEQRELQRLQRRAMDHETYDGLRDNVYELHQREEETGSPFTDEQINRRVTELAARDAEEHAPDYTRRTRGNGRTEDLPPRDTTARDLADRARRYAEEDHPAIFDHPDDAPAQAQPSRPRRRRDTQPPRRPPDRGE